MIAQTLQAPYYAVIFTSIRMEVDKNYAQINDELEAIASEMDGFLGTESARNELGVSVSYWKDLESIKQWRANAKHQFAMDMGKKEWYTQYKVRIAKVERDYEFLK